MYIPDLHESGRYCNRFCNRNQVEIAQGSYMQSCEGIGLVEWVGEIMLGGGDGELWSISP